MACHHFDLLIILPSALVRRTCNPSVKITENILISPTLKSNAKNPVWLFIVNWLRFADNPLHHEQQAVAVQPWIMFPANYLQILTRHNYSNCMNATIKYTHVHAYIHIAHTHILTSTVSNVSNGDCLGWPRRSQIWLSPTNLLPFVSSHTQWPVVGASLSLSPPAPICKGAARAVLSKGYCPFRSISMDFPKVPFWLFWANASLWADQVHTSILQT